MAKVFVQWKGSDVCLDFSCSCGWRGHVDADFAYAVRCQACERVWLLPDTLTLVEDDGRYETSGGIVQDIVMQGHAGDVGHAPYGHRRNDAQGVIADPDSSI